ncbi:MAG: HEAT repeat domain-containing protein [Gammaproteobacteria bacterium]|nr:HEAT repeat domain-containing protein [Gammaproteobacteria bacterium]
MPEHPHTSKPDITVLTGKQCPHCHSVKQSLNEITQTGLIDNIRFIDIEHRPEEFNFVRSVPWIRIGDFEFQGLHTKQELQYWIKQTSDPEGMKNYIDAFLSNGQLHQVESYIRRHPETIHTLVVLTADPQTSMATRIGIGALLEGLQGTGLAKTMTTELEKLNHHPDTKIRADCAHFLGLTENKQAENALKEMLNDTDEEVREIAEEALVQLASTD